ncbi:hypothetical protein VNO78_22332 [Psophocarpus tetragonolobus]|uniref:Secreted protein n=1 Tax=Psophocarpus tetragonolobus TaxID=3891 RepID=A0AAN9SGV6_PSOTE
MLCLSFGCFLTCSVLCLASSRALIAQSCRTVWSKQNCTLLWCCQCEFVYGTTALVLLAHCIGLKGLGFNSNPPQSETKQNRNCEMGTKAKKKAIKNLKRDPSSKSAESPDFLPLEGGPA